MAKTLNKDQIAMLDKEVQKLDKKLDNKDMEKAMGMLMKKVGIKESDLDELSLSMKNMTKSGIGKTGVDKDKLKMGLKDLRKKLDKDKKKDEAHIVRSKKGVASLRRKSYQDNPHTNKGDEKKESVNEIAVAPFVPAAIALGRAAAPHVARGVGNLAKHVFKHKKKYGVGGAVAAVKKAASSSLAKKVAVGAAGAYAGKKAYDAVRNKQKEREAEKKRQDQRQNDA